VAPARVAGAARREVEVTARRWSSDWSGMGESTVVWGVLLLYRVHRMLGRWPFRVCVFPVVLLHWLARPSLRHASLQYLERIERANGAIGHRPGLRDSLRHVMLFADTLLDKLLAVSDGYPLQRIATEGREEFYRLAATGCGGVIVTAHLGCLELCRAMADRRGELRLTILVHTRHAQRFNNVLRRLNPSAGMRLLEVQDFGPGTAMLLQERVAAGEFVVIAGDRTPIASRHSVTLPFLGHRARFPTGPYLIAAALRCPLVMLACIHRGDSYLVHFAPLAERVELGRGRRAADLTVHAGRYVEELTRVLRHSPYDWFNFYPFWDQGDDGQQPS
jgi:predicted LPLAT superfamily acyltransferase